METRKWGSGLASALGPPVPRSACTDLHVACTQALGTHRMPLRPSTHTCVCAPHLAQVHADSCTCSPTHSPVHSSDFKRWPARWVPGTQWGTSPVEPWLLGAHGPGGAQLPVINSQNHMCARGGLGMQQRVGLDGVLEAFPEEVVLGLESAGG